MALANRLNKSFITRGTENRFLPYGHNLIQPSQRRKHTAPRRHRRLILMAYVTLRVLLYDTGFYPSAVRLFRGLLFNTSVDLRCFYA